MVFMVLICNHGKARLLVGRPTPPQSISDLSARRLDGSVSLGVPSTRSTAFSRLSSKSCPLQAKMMEASLKRHGPSCGFARVCSGAVLVPTHQPVVSDLSQAGIHQRRAVRQKSRERSPPLSDGLLGMINAGQKTQAEMARVFKINRSVISRLISKQRIEDQKAAEPVIQ